MKLHEYQAKLFFAREGIPVPKSGLANTPIEARQVASELGYPVVLKAQVLSGGRGKAGGIRLVRNDSEIDSNANLILNSQIRGIPVQRLLVEKAVDFSQEFYLGIVNDRSLARPILILSSSGGIEIEEVAQTFPEHIEKAAINPLVGLQNYTVRALASKLGIDSALWKPLQQISASLWKLFDRLDATLVEINPLAVTTEGTLMALDGKMTIDDNALYRQKDFLELSDQIVETPTEQEARKFCLNYIQLNGNIGCMVNGAGLAMATMDCIQQAGSEPANFLDIGGGATADKVSAALSIIMKDPKVSAVLINIFGGITRCDEVAKGLAAIIPEMPRSMPIVVRLAGTNAEEGRKILEGYPQLLQADTLMSAAEIAVRESRQVPA
ncbi:MAG: ADP-forming succinate--CoA ligase subunit beta [Anaerolineaceae bacterium]